MLLLGHIDVVVAKREDWTRDPYKLVEENGYFYGRGTSDMKAMDTRARIGRAPTSYGFFRPPPSRPRYCSRLARASSPLSWVSLISSNAATVVSMATL